MTSRVYRTRCEDCDGVGFFECRATEDTHGPYYEDCVACEATGYIETSQDEIDTDNRIARGQ